MIQQKLIQELYKNISLSKNTHEALVVHWFDLVFKDRFLQENPSATSQGTQLSAKSSFSATGPRLPNPGHTIKLNTASIYQAAKRPKKHNKPSPAIGKDEMKTTVGIVAEFTKAAPVTEYFQHLSVTSHQYI